MYIMALQVWLPLNGNLNNQGLSNVTVTNNGATVDNNGKIGKCYKPATITLTNLNNLSFNNISFSFWAKTTSTDSWQLIIGIDNTSNSQIHGIYVADTGRIKLEYNPSLNIYTTPTNWHHYCFVIKNGDHKAYLDGVLVTTSSEASTNDQIGRLRLGVAQNVSINDVRIYDHCLSPREVHEISQALILHYKLDDIYSESTTNIATSLTPQANKGGWGSLISTKLKTNTYHIKHDRAASDSNLSYWSTFVYTLPSSYANKTISFSASIQNISMHDVNASTSWLFIGQGNDGQYPTHGSVSYYYNQLYENMRISWSGTLSNSNRYLVIELWNNDNNTNGCIEFDLYDIQIEEKDHSTGYTENSRTGIMYDDSGYQNNGTISGDIQMINSNARYRKCARVTTNGRIIYPFPHLQVFTYSLWFKRNRTSYSNREMLGTGWYGISMELNTNNTLTFRHQLTSGTFDVRSTATFTSTSDWYHIVLTRDASGVSKIYVNGVLDKSGTNANQINYTSSTAELFTYSNTSYQFQGCISDFRIYATALSAADIKSLYNVGAVIDNGANMHTYEYHEIESTTPKVHRTGVTDSSAIIEPDTITNASFSKAGIIKAKNFYEI